MSLGLDEADAQRQQLDVYKEHFQAPFLEATKNFYEAESKAFVANNSVPDYMKKAEDRLQEEVDRVNMYLHESTLKEVRDYGFVMRVWLTLPAEGELRRGPDPRPCRDHDRRVPALAECGQSLR